MALVNSTPLLGLGLPTTGDLNGTWGTAVNVAVTSLIDTAIAGTTTLSTDGDVILTDTDFVANEARAAILRWTATGTVTRNITAPAQSKAYIVINATGGSQSIVIRGAGPTTGVTVVSGEKCVVAWSGSDFVKVASSVVDGVTSVALSAPTGFTVAGSPITSTGTLALAFDTGYSLPTNASQANWNTAYSNNLQWDGGSTNLVAATGRTSLGATTVGGSIFTLADPSAVSFLRVNADNTVTALTATNFRTAISAAVSGANSDITSLAGLTTALSAAQGGTGLTAPGTSGNALISNGTAWTSAPIAGMVYPGTGIAVSTGSAWGTSLTAPSGTIVGTSDTQTLTNKRITSRVSSSTSWTSPLAWNSDTFDQYQATAQNGAVTISADAGTPTDGQKMIFRIKDNGTARALTWTTGTSKSFRAVGTTLPTSTVANKTLYVGGIYNSADSRWDVIMVTQEI